MPLLPVDYAVRNLSRSPMRTVLTIAGSTLVVLLILTAGGFVTGMRAALRMTGGEHNVILLGSGSEESVERSEIPASAPSVLAASVSGIRTRAGVDFISPEVHVMLPVGLSSEDRSARQAMLRGVTPAATLVHDSVSLIEGRWPSKGTDELLLGRTAPTALGADPTRLLLGSSLWIDGRPWTIVGRFAAQGTTVEAELWLPLDDLKTITQRDTISCVVLTLEPWNDATGEGAEFADVAAFTKMRPDLELAAMPEREYYQALASFFGPIRVVAWVTAGLIALGGLLGGLNTMYAAFASRIRELATLQAIGFRRIVLVVSMIQEAVLATSTGALIACATALLLLDGVAVRFSMGAFGLVIDATVILIGLASGLLLGALGALPPALRCLSPSIPVALKAA